MYYWELLLIRCQPTGFGYFLLTQQFFWYFYHQYFTNAKSKAYQPYHFLKELNKTFQVHSCFASIGRKYKSWPNCDILVTITLRVNMVTRQMIPFFSSAFWFLSVSIFHLRISRHSKFNSIGSALHNTF